MAERNTQRAQQARNELRDIVGFSAADEIVKLERLRKSGAISNEEYARLRDRAVRSWRPRLRFSRVRGSATGHATRPLPFRLLPAPKPSSGDRPNGSRPAKHLLAPLRGCRRLPLHQHAA